MTCTGRLTIGGVLLDTPPPEGVYEVVEVFGTMARLVSLPSRSHVTAWPVAQLVSASHND